MTGVRVDIRLYPPGLSTDMPGPALRLAMALVGVAVVTVYAAAALGGYLLLSWLFRTPLDLGVALAAVASLTVLGGYLGYRVGTARLLARVGATELPRRRASALHRRLDRLAAAMDVHPPPLLVADLGAPNAMSIGGPRSAAIVLDRSLLGLLTLDELEGILAHEMAHVESNDAFVQTLAASAARSLAGLLFALLLPVVLLVVGVGRAAAWFAGRPAQASVTSRRLLRGVELGVGLVLSLVTLLVLSYSRRRELAADERAAEVTGRPAALARALVKMHAATNPTRGLRSLLTIHGDEREGWHRLVSTHPPVRERIERLVEADRRWLVRERGAFG